MLALACGPASCSPAPTPAPQPPAAATAPGAELRVGEGAAALGDGFVVWESNRTGVWRIWTRNLDGSDLSQLTRDEPGRQHCCPHISPDGTRIVYLSQPGDWQEYPEDGATGELRLLTLAGGAERVLVPAARTYDWGNRAAVWRSDQELVYIAADGTSRLLDVATGASKALTAEPRAAHGWLIDPTLSYATNGKASFSLYDRDRQQVLPRRELGGCEPFFSLDGRWGYWISGGGGPIDRIDLATQEITTLVRKNDPRLGAKGYLYFPMLSRDGRLLVFGASAGGHNHFESDYDVYGFPVDPETFEISGPAIRFTDNPATDRYPDVFLAPLPLGRHRGEAPLTVAIPPGAAGGAAGEPVAWDWGDGASETAAAGRHVYTEPGTFTVRAEAPGGSPEDALRGLVVVDPARPPRVTGQDLREGGRELRVAFDEPVRLTEGFAAAWASGRAVAGTRLDGGGRVLVVALPEPLSRPDRLTLRGVEDRAERPNRMDETTLEVAPPSWPATRDDLVFLWRNGDSPNLVYDPVAGTERTYTLEADGRARLDHDFAMVLGDGAFVAPEEASARLQAAATASNELTIEATLTPGAPTSATTAGLSRIVTFSSGMRRRNFTLGQEGDQLVIRIRTGPTGANAGKPQVPLFTLTPGEPVHVVVTFAPGRLRAYRNGELVVESAAIEGSFGMHWRDGRLVFGDEWGGGGAWDGTLEGVALYSRALSPELARESWLRYEKILAARPDVPRTVVRARLVAPADVPTLAEISPYRQALAVFGYEIVGTVEGPPVAERGERIGVARWVILDGETLPTARGQSGRAERLVLEPFADNPQLEGVYLSEGTAGGAGGPLYYAVEP